MPSKSTQSAQTACSSVAIGECSAASKLLKVLLDQARLAQAQLGKWVCQETQARQDKSCAKFVLKTSPLEATGLLKALCDVLKKETYQGRQDDEKTEFATDVVNSISKDQIGRIK